MEVANLLHRHISDSSAAQQLTKDPNPSMEPPAKPTQLQVTTMPSESVSQKPALEACCPTPPNASPTKDTAVANLASYRASPPNPTPKHVSFELLLDDASKTKARIPMRVQIFPHDTTDSIVTTVKNFYGIYEATASGVSFEDENGITLIARYENFRNNMTVYVRVIPKQYPDHYGHHQTYCGPGSVDNNKRPALGEPFQPNQTSQGADHGRSGSRPGSRASRKRSTSPSGRGRRSASTAKGLSRAGYKSRGSSTHGSFHDDPLASYDSDATHDSKKTRNEPIASSDISMDNILPDGRRKRPKFDSSELPLFAPPQVPLATSTSSMSPQRRSTIQEAGSPAQQPFGMNQPLPSPQSFGHHEQLYALQSGSNPYATPAPQHGHRLRDRSGIRPASYYPSTNNRSGGSGILPTPDPTIASCISDEDVAMQLIRLGDASNFSHGRTSTSTADDAFSGIADASSSTGATSDGEASGDEDDLPSRSKQDPDDALPTSEDYPQDNIKSEYDDDPLYEDEPAVKRTKQKTSSKASSKAQSSKASKNPKARATPASRKSKPAHATAVDKSMGPPPPAKAPSQRAALDLQLSAGDEDLSSKPRCQRCRKSKKGCDRQRPCGRCRDAGIGLEGCISEDEGNGRKGRYGRHMGVSVKKAMADALAARENQAVAAASVSPAAADKNKKRKR
ncbi:hypothetical protein VTO42DRAFT_7318 [Malbranchea cinnamomea]